MKPSRSTYFASLVGTSLGVIIGLLLTLSFANTVTDIAYAEKILENVIQLDGVLFGFTGVMFGLLHGKPLFRLKKMQVNMFLMTSFWSYLVSILSAFSFLFVEKTNSWIMFPVGVTAFGAVCSSVYVMRILAENEEISA
jgi:hypothetical protein